MPPRSSARSSQRRCCRRAPCSRTSSTPTSIGSSSRLPASSASTLKLLERFEPWFLAVTLLDQGMRKLGFQAERGVEQYVLGQAQRTEQGDRRARDARVPDRHLRCAAAGVAAGDARADASGARRSRRRRSSEMADAWRNGELESLSAELLDDFERFPGALRDARDEAQQAWVPTLERMLADGRRASRRRRRAAPRRPATTSSSCSAHAATTSSARALAALRPQTSTISKSSLPEPQSGQRHDSGMSAHFVPGGIPSSGRPSASS